MDQTVIIIGAGISGLAAANRFTQKGFKDFIILESSNYIGGRINTIPFQNSFIEIGAQWMHGTVNNPVYDIALSLNAVDTSADTAQTRYYSIQDGTRQNENLVEAIEKDTLKIIENLKNLIDENKFNQSLGELLDQTYPILENKYKLNLDPLIIRGIFSQALNNQRFESACDDLYDVSANGWNNFEILEGDLLCKNKYGYSKITDYLASKLADGLIKLNQIVEKIDWLGDEVVVSVLDSLSGKRTNYNGKAVLSTVSLGILKRNHSQLFKPSLPLSKIQSIDRLGFGILNKIFIIFDGDFEPDFQGVQIIWKDTLGFELQWSKTKWNLDNSDFFKAFDNYEKLPNHKNVLFCFNVGKNADYIEKLEDECILDVISELLERNFPFADLPKPIKVIRSKWNSNPNTRGTYSYIKVGSSIEDMKTLAQNVDNKLFFAGEATTFKYYGTVHGAYITGYERAEEILASLENSLE
ncbi:unnamed protein product [Brachionus calyciflorus]|uniref:Amine oxidase domain-containing protein n=1 Tax=Brachionus calyciflorus TaxID=104777 RepID=A0A813M3Q9_9BILA|nr:unnamed protein product [Brachionus calyciflorus]